jgi:hypothetical protein
LLAACEDKKPAPPAAEQPVRRPLAPAEPVTESQRNIAAEAAKALNHYYALIAAGAYDDAYRLRTPGRVDAKRFAANFAAYERYSALVGTPTVPVRAGGFVWVQLPVMITGSFKGGKPFGSSGNVVLRRAAGGGDWQVVTDG